MKVIGLNFNPVGVTRLLGPLSMFGPRPALLGLITSQNSPNGGLELSLAAQPPLLPPPTHQSPYVCHL